MSYPIIPIFIPHIGCPHDCVFCNQRRIAGETRAPEPEQVSAQLFAAFQETECAEVAFYGGSFTAIEPERQRAYLCAVAPFAAQVSGIRVSTRPDAITPEIIALLRAGGVTLVELGAQSMDDAVLKASGRGHTAEDTRRAVAHLRAAGMPYVLQMMVGLPGEKTGSARETARALAALHPVGVRVYPTVVVRDTQLEALWRAGAYAPLEVERAVELCAQIAEIFDAACVPIIRMGLNPTRDLSGGDALAGAYHPAFGQLVAARRRLLRLRALLSGHAGEAVTIYANPRELSEVAGHRGENRARLIRECGIKALRILPDAALAPHEMRVVHGKYSQNAGGEFD